MLFPKYFCRVDDYGVKSKVAFDIANDGYKSEQESIYFIREMLSIKQEVVKTSKVVEMSPPPPLSSSASEAVKKECKLPKKPSASTKLLLKLH